MINLKSAVRTSAKMKRSGDGVKLVGIKNVEKDFYARLENPTIIRAKARGSKEDYKCEIVYKSNPNKCKVFCECADFKFTFYKAINEQGGASRRIKNDEEYQGKGTGVIRAIEKPGLCKHLVALAETI